MGLLRWIVVLLALSACSPRGELSLVPGAVDVGQQRTVFVGTTRVFDPETRRFSGARSWEKTYARYDISIPPNRTAGEINWPRRGAVPDPRTDFVTTGEQIFANDRAFAADLGRALRAEPNDERDAIIFVHGFNTTFSEGLYRIAQLSNDLRLPGVAMHFSWPSIARPLGYVQDRDSAAFSRDGLEQLIKDTAAAGAKEIVLVAHSMGAGLLMETLRQIEISGDRRTMARIGGVVLIAPDIDVDVFRSHALRMGELPQPFMIFTSQRDRALALSARLTGQSARLGNLIDPTPIGDLEVTLFEVGEFSDGTGHFTPGDNPALISILTNLTEVNNSFNADQSGRIDLLSGTVLTLQRATQVVLSPVAELAVEIQN